VLTFSNLCLCFIPSLNSLPIVLLVSSRLWPYRQQVSQGCPRAWDVWDVPQEPDANNSHKRIKRDDVTSLLYKIIHTNNVHIIFISLDILPISQYPRKCWVCPVRRCALMVKTLDTRGRLEEMWLKMSALKKMTNKHVFFRQYINDKSATALQKCLRYAPSGWFILFFLKVNVLWERWKVRSCFSRTLIK
jgi:hypothetical protein